MLRELLDARSLRHTGLHGIDPCVTRRRKGKELTEFALQHVRTVHNGTVVAKDTRFDDIYAGIGQLPNALGIGKVLIDLAHELALVIEQKGLGSVKERKMQIGKRRDGLGELSNRQVRIHLAVYHFAVGVDLGAVGGNKVHLVANGCKELAQAIVAAA